MDNSLLLMARAPPTEGSLNTRLALWAANDRAPLLLESVTDYAIFMLDPEGKVQTWNPGAERVKGYLAEEIIGQPFSRFYIPEDVLAGKPEFLLRQARETGQAKDEAWRVRKDGTRFWADVVINAIIGPQGELLGFAKITRDLTERRMAEVERLRLAQAEESVRLRDEFLAIASHELKTPVTALRLQLTAALKRQIPDSKESSLLARAVKSTERLDDLIETLLDVSRLSTGRFTLHPEVGDLEATAHEVVERLRAAADRSGCVFEEDLQPVQGCWDLLRVEQMLSNLLANAIKYAAGSPISLRLYREGDVAVLTVADRGPGMAAEDFSRLFNRFERAASQRHFGGLGLGLYVAREIAQAHGGELNARNREGGGAVFTARLPLGLQR